MKVTTHREPSRPEDGHGLRRLPARASGGAAPRRRRGAAAGGGRGGGGAGRGAGPARSSRGAVPARRRLFRHLAPAGAALVHRLRGSRPPPRQPRGGRDTPVPRSPPSAGLCRRRGQAAAVRPSAPGAWLLCVQQLLLNAEAKPGAWHRAFKKQQPSLPPSCPPLLPPRRTGTHLGSAAHLSSPRRSSPLLSFLFTCTFPPPLSLAAPPSPPPPLHRPRSRGRLGAPQLRSLGGLPAPQPRGRHLKVDLLNLPAVPPSALLGPKHRHGCKILPGCGGQLASRRPLQPGLCPVFGLLQLQQGDYSRVWQFLPPGPGPVPREPESGLRRGGEARGEGMPESPRSAGGSLRGRGTPGRGKLEAAGVRRAASLLLLRRRGSPRGRPLARPRRPLPRPGARAFRSGATPARSRRYRRGARPAAPRPGNKRRLSRARSRGGLRPGLAELLPGLEPLRGSGSAAMGLGHPCEGGRQGRKGREGTGRLPPRCVAGGSRLYRGRSLTGGL